MFYSHEVLLVVSNFVNNSSNNISRLLFLAYYFFRIDKPLMEDIAEEEEVRENV